MIKELQRTAVMRDPTMAAATLVGAQGEAMKSAAKNEGGAMLGFMGLNMASAAGSMNPQQLYQMGGRPQAAEPTPAAPASWTCSCGAQNSGKFCTECGSPRPTGWTCSCGPTAPLCTAATNAAGSQRTQSIPPNSARNAATPSTAKISGNQSRYLITCKDHLVPSIMLQACMGRGGFP